jgi:HAE1 family hydrophobic/amphiphilic exporter-1
MLFVTIIVFGWKSYQQLPVNLMPNISYPTLTVRTEYEGAAPEDVEKLVTRPLEEALSIVSGLVEISSVSSPGTSEIMLEFTWGTDMNVALQELRDRLDLFDAPKEITQKPIILRYDPTLDPVLRVAITGSDFSDAADPAKRAQLIREELTSIREACERHVKGDLEAENGIAQVLVKGGREQEVVVRVDAERLKNLGLSLQDVANALAQQNINLSGGRLREGKTEYLVRTLNEFQDIAEIRNSIIGTPKARPNLSEAPKELTGGLAGLAGAIAGGQQLRLSDIAEVSIGEKERETVVHINGKEAVALEAYKDGDANTVQVCTHVKDALGFKRARSFGEQLSDAMAKTRGITPGESAVERGDPTEMLARKIRSRLPRTVQFTLISDQSRFIIAAINEAQGAAIQGGMWALLVIFLFLHRLSATVIIGLAIPISLIATFIPMHMKGMTLNVMSLGGLALAVGHLVDDSIIVLESIHRCAEEGDVGKNAVERGVREILSADVSTTVTNVVVFLPITFVAGVAGQIFGNFAFTMTFSLLASLLVALYLDTMLASLSKVQLKTGHDVVWAVRAYYEARQGGAQRRRRALVQMLPLGVRYAASWTWETTQETFGPTVLRFKDLRAGATLPRLAACMANAALLPVILLLYVLQLALKAVATVSITVLFGATVLVLAVLWVLRVVLRVVLWAPLGCFDFLFATIKRSYAQILRVCLQFGPVVLVIAGLLAVHAVSLTNRLGRELIPPMKQGEFGVRMEAPPGTRLEVTEKLAQKVEEVIMATPEIASVGVEIGIEKTKTHGERGENIALFNVLLKDPERMVRYQEAIIEKLRRRIAEVSAEQITFVLPTLFSFKTAVELQIRGDDLEELKRVGGLALEALKDIDGLKDPELSVKKGYPEVIIELDRDQLAARGISPIQVAQRLRTEVQGDVATRFSRAGEKIDIRVRADQARLQSLQDLRNISVMDGYPPIPLASVAKIAIQDGPSEIRRIDQRQVVIIRGNVEGFDLGRVSREIEKRLENVPKPKEYTFVLGGQNRELRTSYSSLQFALILSIFLVYVVMACQFESLIQPALIMFTIPLGFVGVINVLYWMSIPLSIAVFMGGILLVGMVVNNSILLVDYANQLRQRGRTKRQAIYESGQVRFRPVLMTAITTIVGAIPMAMGGVEGAELRRPLAITVIAGLSVATVLTLVIIPVVYDLFAGRDKKA